MKTPSAELSELFLDMLADKVADRVVRRLRSDQDDWIDGPSSPGGTRWHNGVARRRIATGQGGAAKIGRRYLLSKEALAEELAATGKARTTKQPQRAESVSERLQRKLRLVGDNT